LSPFCGAPNGRFVPVQFAYSAFLLLLRSNDQETDDLQAMLNDVYDRSGYDYFIDYRVDPLPSV